MTVLASFGVDSEELPVGQLVRETAGVTLELERIVSTEDVSMPYLWASGDDFVRFERNLAACPPVVDFDRLDRFDDAALYRVEWQRGQGLLVRGIVDADGAVLVGEVGRERTRFLVRFPDHDDLARFYNFCIEHDIGVRMKQVYSLTDRSERAREFDLTPEQREALVLAARHGYFTSPRETTLDELADRLDISQQAISQRIRGGTEKVILEALGLARSEAE